MSYHLLSILHSPYFIRGKIRQKILTNWVPRTRPNSWTRFQLGSRPVLNFRTWFQLGSVPKIQIGYPVPLTLTPSKTMGMPLFKVVYRVKLLSPLDLTPWPSDLPIDLKSNMEASKRVQEIQKLYEKVKGKIGQILIHPIKPMYTSIRGKSSLAPMI